jgi:hypothetical protein
MPVYDCGAPECTECKNAFGPDRSKAIANFKRREEFYETLPQPPTTCIEHGPGGTLRLSFQIKVF